MKCAQTASNEENVLTLKGELSISHAARLKAELIQALDAAPRIVIDVNAVTDVDLSALQLLCAAHKSALAKGKQLILSPDLPETLTRQIQKAGLMEGHHCGRDSGADCLWKGGDR